MKLRCLVVDDEPVARQGMVEYIRETDFLQLQAEASNAVEAAAKLAEGNIDLILLDIQMPGMTGLEFLRTLKNPPMVIITTAFSEFALEGFELDVMDYLVKPIPYPRFLKAVTKAHDFRALKTHDASSTPEVNFMFVKSNGKFERVFFDDIVLVEAMQNYVVLHVNNQKLVVYMTMGGMETQLPTTTFMRVHKSFIVPVGKVQAIQNHELTIDKFKVPVSRTLYEAVCNRILGDNLAKRQNQ
jgi:DNA-binding LytR/AlgR family response regulator